MIRIRLKKLLPKRPPMIRKGFEKLSRPAKISLLILLIFTGSFVLMGGFVFAYRKTFEKKIYWGVALGGVDVGGMTREAAEDVLKSEVEDYKKDNFVIESPAHKVEWHPDLNDLGVAYDYTSSLQNAYQQGRQGFWADALKEQITLWLKKKNLPLIYKIDEKKFNNYLSDITKKVDKPAVNTYLGFEGDRLKVVPAKKGLIVDKEKLKELIKTRIQYLAKERVLLPFKTDEPQIKDEDTKEVQIKAKAMVAMPLRLIYQDRVFIASSSQIASWINFIPVKEQKKSQDAFLAPIKQGWSLKIVLNQDKLREFLVTIAKEIDIEPKDTVVMFSDGQKNVIEQGHDGRFLDIDNAVSQIKRELETESDREVTLVVKTVPAGEVEATSYGIVPITKAKYIDVSLSRQVLTCFDGGKAQFVTLISSGINKYPTPTGTFTVYSKTPSTRMRHEYGPGHPDNYDLPNVPYVLYFSGPYAIHGTYWHNNFGTPMSHGCINAPTPAAEWIYNWAPIGTMVYIHW